MKHALQISVSKVPPDGGLVQCRTVTLREKLLTRLFGSKRRLTILVPGDSVESLSIEEVEGGGADNE